MSDGNVKLLMFSDIEGCQADQKYPQSTFLCSKSFYEEIARRLDGDPNLHIAFLGDYFDQGMRVYESINGILGLLNKYPDRVHAILGNRDVNKLRFCFEILHRLKIKNSIFKMTSQDINSLNPITEETTKPDGTIDKKNKCPEFDKGWKAWSPYYFGIHKNEIIEPPNYTIKGVIDESDVGLVKHILYSSMGAGKSENNKMTGLFSFMPFEKISSADEKTAVKYLKVTLGLEPRGNDTQDALDLLDFFSKCKLAHVFKGPGGRVLLAHGGGFDSDAFFDEKYVESFGVNMGEDILPEDYHTILEQFRKKLSGKEEGNIMSGGQTPQLEVKGTPVTKTSVRTTSARDLAKKYDEERISNQQKTKDSQPVLNTEPKPEQQSVLNVESEPEPQSVLNAEPVSSRVSDSVNVYNELLQDVIGEIREKRFTWKFVLLQALGLKPDSEDARYKSLIQSCSQDGCTGPNNPLSTDMDEKKLEKILKDSGITHVSYGHKPICFPIPVIYKRKEIGVTFISNDTSNGNRKVDEVGNSTAIGTMVIFSNDGKPENVQSKIEPIVLGKVEHYKAMYAPLTLATTPSYEDHHPTGAKFLKYGDKNVVFNKGGYDQLKFVDIAPSSGGRRRSKNRKRNTKRVSRYISKRTRRNKKTRRGRKIRKY